MQWINVPFLLRKYQSWLSADSIQFLPKGKDAHNEVLKHLKSLTDIFEKASSFKGGLSVNLDWYETHKKGRDLWYSLLSSSLNSIDENSKGNSELFDYLDKATSFEDVLYGSEPYYRDHTLHSLWVYFIGEYMMRDLLPDIHENLNWYLYNDFELESSTYKSDLMSGARNREKTISDQVNNKRDAIWCIMALCHDLGYSAAKLDMINDRVQDVLKFFDLPSFSKVGYSLEIEKQYLITQVLELMAMEVRLVPSQNYRDSNVEIDEKVKARCYRDDSTYWRLCRALEKKQHGILSAYLIYKTLSIFAEASVRGTAEEWGLDDTEAVENIVRGDILFAIAQHEFDFAHMIQLGSLAEILFVADELEEFSRYGRQLLTRKYFDTTAHAAIHFVPENPAQGEDIEIEMFYDYNCDRGLEDLFPFFWRKAQRLCKIYSLDQPEDEAMKGYCTISRIKLTVQREKYRFYFELSRGAENRNKGLLPKTEIEGKEYDGGEYTLSCMDDRIDVHTDADKKINLMDWCNNAHKRYLAS